MTDLYSRNGAYPEDLPTEAIDPTGRIWTAPIEAEGREACGFVLAPTAPAYDPLTEVLTWDGSAWVVETTPPPPPPTKAELSAYAMNARWMSEQAGIVIDGIGLPTNDKGQSYISGAYAAALANPTEDKLWQVGNAPLAFEVFPNARIRALGLGLNALTQATFDKLADVASAIEGEAITTTAQIDAAFAAVNRVFTTPAE